MGQTSKLCGRVAFFFAAGIFISLNFSAAPCSAQVTLQASLTPTVMIDGPLGSLQQVQYSTNLADTNGWMGLSFVRLDVVPKPFFDTTAGGQRRFYRTKLAGVADTNLVWIPPGTFLMGSSTNEAGRTPSEGVQTQVTLTEGFLMGRYEVRYPEMKAYVTNYIGDVVGAPNIAQFAANEVSWTNAMLYCALRTDHERMQGMIPPDWAYRLPTEAEWEYACRAGTTTTFSFGNEIRHDGFRSDANMDGRFPYPTNLVAVAPVIALQTNVGSFGPNAFGLYDMHGNLAEYCFDRMGGIIPLSGGAVTNPVAPVVGLNAVIRGGNTSDEGVYCRSASRRIVNIFTAGTGSQRGFRVVLSPTNVAVLPHP